MSEKIKKIILLLLVIGGLLALRTFKNNETKKGYVSHGRLLSVSYYCGGGMLGDHYEEALTVKDDRISYVVSLSGQAGLPLQVKEYRADEKLLDQVRTFIIDHDLPSFSDLPQSEVFALDISEETYVITFDDREYGGTGFDSYSVSSDQVLPQGGAELLDRLREMMAEPFEEKEPDDVYILDLNDDRLYSGPDNSDEEIGLLLQGEWIYEDGEDELIVDVSGPGSIDLYRHFAGMEASPESYHPVSIVHEPLADCPSFWQVIAEAESGKIILTVNAGRMYLYLGEEPFILERRG